MATKTSFCGVTTDKVLVYLTTNSLVTKLYKLSGLAGGSLCMKFEQPGVMMTNQAGMKLVPLSGSAELRQGEVSEVSEWKWVVPKFH